MIIECKQKYNEKLNDKVFNHYGYECRLCKSKKNLGIDHILENGKDFREETGCDTGNSTYHWIIKHNFPKDLQTLCISCNVKKNHFFRSPNMKWRMELLRSY